MILEFSVPDSCFWAMSKTEYALKPINLLVFSILAL